MKVMKILMMIMMIMKMTIIKWILMCMKIEMMKNEMINEQWKILMKVMTIKILMIND